MRRTERLEPLARAMHVVIIHSHVCNELLSPIRPDCFDTSSKQ